jgi:spermidine synthase
MTIKSYSSLVLPYTGLLAELFEEEDVPGEWVLTINKSLHSALDVNDPTNLSFYYAKKLGSIIETLFPAKEKLSVLHLGAGALSIARYIDATRPGSYQVAVEIEDGLVEFVESVLPFNKTGTVDVIIGDGRDVVQSRIRKFARKFDLVIVELFLDRTTPANSTSIEFYRLLKKTLTSDGVLIMNVIDGDDYKFAASTYVTIKEAFSNVKAVLDEKEFKIKTPGNVLVVGSNGNTLGALRDFSDLEPRPAVVLDDVSGIDWQKIGVVINDSSSIDWTSPLKEEEDD